MSYPQGFAAQGYPQQYQPHQQSQGFGQQQPPQQYQQPQQEAPALAEGSLEDFFGQPSAAGGPALKFDNPGDSYVGIVARPLNQGDVKQQTIPGSNAPATFRDGKPKFVLQVPLLVQPDERFTDGRATWYCQGGARDELVRAMAEAGAPAGAPEGGAGLVITMTGTRPSGPGLNPRKVFSIQYSRPDNAAPPEQAPAPAPEPQPQVQQPVSAAAQTPLPGPSAGDQPEDKSALLARLKAAQTG